MEGAFYNEDVDTSISTAMDEMLHIPNARCSSTVRRDVLRASGSFSHRANVPRYGPYDTVGGSTRTHHASHPRGPLSTPLQAFPTERNCPIIQKKRKPATDYAAGLHNILSGDDDNSASPAGEKAQATDVVERLLLEIGKGDRVNALDSAVKDRRRDRPSRSSGAVLEAAQHLQILKGYQLSHLQTEALQDVSEVPVSETEMDDDDVGVDELHGLDSKSPTANKQRGVSTPSSVPIFASGQTEFSRPFDMRDAFARPAFAIPEEQRVPTVLQGPLFKGHAPFDAPFDKNSFRRRSVEGTRGRPLPFEDDADSFRVPSAPPSLKSLVKRA